MNPKTTNRRRFLKQAAGTAVGVAATTAVPPNLARAADGGRKYIVGFMGTGGRGGFLMDRMLERGDIEVAYVCDADRSRMVACADRAEKVQGRRPRMVGDFRRMLDDKNVQAIVNATPDHWHALGTIMACQAEKDVYVEKPASYCIHEGRKMVEAARKYKRIVQLGTQSRSGEYIPRAIEFIRSGKIGDVHFVRVVNMKNLVDIGHREDEPAPQGVDFDMWLGPAPKRAFNHNRFHGTWHWIWDYSGGDIINDGVHQIDITRWMIGQQHAKTVCASGGRHVFRDDKEVPDVQVVTWEFDGVTVVFELVLWAPYMKKLAWELHTGDTYPDWKWDGMRIELFGTKGFMFMMRQGGGWDAFDGDNKPLMRINDHQPHIKHMDNFFKCVDSRKRPNADIEDGHLSTVLCQMGNISYHLGGRKLHFDGATERFEEAEANALLKRPTYREPWVIPDQV